MYVQPLRRYRAPFLPHLKEGVSLSYFDELAHAVEFIVHGAGLTPAQVDDAFDEGVVDISLFDVCSGRGIRDDMEAGLIEQDAAAVMENRVERKGTDWLNWALARLPAKLIQDCAQAYAPRQRHQTIKVDNPAP